MTAIHETAYPRLRAQLTDQQLQEWYTPIPDELRFVERQAQSHVARLGLLVLLKTFQRLGYFPSGAAIPLRLVVHLAATVGVSNAADAWQKYEHSQFRWQHMQRIRQYLRVNAYSDGGRRVLLSALGFGRK